MASTATTDWGDDSHVVSFFKVPEDVHTVDRKGVPVHVRQLRQARSLVDQSGILADLNEYRDEDGRDPKKGGRPFMVTDRQIVTMMLLLVMEGSPFQITRARDLVVYRLTKKARAELGITIGGNVTDWYTRLWRAFQRMMRPIDPFQGEQRRRRFTKEEWEVIVAGRVPDVVESRTMRLHHVMNRLVWASVMATPAHLRACWDGTIGFDGTSYIASKKGTRAASDKVSSECNASWYRREDNHRGTDGADPRDAKDGGGGKSGKNIKRGKDTVMWAWESILITMASPGPCAAFPRQILGVALGRPGVQPTQQFWRAAENLIVNDLPRGYAAADRQFLPGAKAEELQEPLRALGYRTVSEQIAGKTGQTASHDGAIQVDGNWYCPAMPPILITVLEDFRHRRIDEVTKAVRLLRRRTFILREKERLDDGSFRYKCPAIGPGATCECPLRKLAAASTTATGAKTVLVVPAEPRGVCKKQSITIPLNVGSKYGQQGTQYGLKHWHDTYIHPRQMIEGRNRLLKQDVVGWERHSMRPMRGYAAQAFGVALGVVALNVVIAKAFLLRGEVPEEDDPSPSPRTVRGEDNWIDPEVLVADDRANAPGLAA